MNRLEHELRNALRREAPPADFAQRVLARVAQASAAPSRKWSLASLFSMRSIRWAMAGALALILLAGGFRYEKYRQEEQARGEVAKAQLMLALRITGSKLQFAQHKIRGLQVPRTNRD